MSKPLKLSIQTGDPRAIFKQVVDGISLAIARDELQEGDKLPSVRALAMQLSVNPNTIAKAYADLTAHGLRDARQGLGRCITATKKCCACWQLNSAASVPCRKPAVPHE
jgi:GntR family transcriptional regulator